MRGSGWYLGVLAALALALSACSSSKKESPCERAVDRRIALEVESLPEEIREEHAAVLRKTTGYRLRKACEAAPRVARWLDKATDRDEAAACLAESGNSSDDATAATARR